MKGRRRRLPPALERWLCALAACGPGWLACGGAQVQPVGRSGSGGAADAAPMAEDGGRGGAGGAFTLPDAGPGADGAPPPAAELDCTGAATLRGNAGCHFYATQIPLSYENFADSCFVMFVVNPGTRPASLKLDRGGASLSLAAAARLPR